MREYDDTTYVIGVREHAQLQNQKKSKNCFDECSQSKFHLPLGKVLRGCFVQRNINSTVTAVPCDGNKTKTKTN